MEAVIEKVKSIPTRESPTPFFYSNQRDRMNFIKQNYPEGRIVYVRIFYRGYSKENLFQGKNGDFGKIPGEIASALFYSKPLWGGEFLGFEAPSLRSIFDIGMNIAAMAIPGLGWLGSAAFNLIDDFAFTVADVGAGVMEFDEALVGFGKKMVTSVASAALGEIGKVVGDGLKLGNDLVGVIGKTAIQGVKSFASNAVSGAVNSITYRHGGNWGFDANNWAESMWGTQALAGYAGGMAATFTGGLMGTMNLRTNGGVDIKDGGGIDAGSIGSFNNLVGSAFGAMTEYAIGGQTTLNLLRINDVGVFEMRLGGNRPMFGLGMGGYDMSIGTIASAVKGIAESRKVLDWKNGGLEKSRTLDLVAMAAYAGNSKGEIDAKLLENSKKVWSGELEVAYERIAGSENSDVDALGYFDRKSPNRLVISDTLLGSGLETAAQTMSVFAHEGTHYNDNRKERVAHDAGMETYVNVVRNLGISYDESFLSGIEQARLDSAGFQDNTGDVDYWIRRLNGTVEYDGSRDMTIEYIDKNGKIKKKTAADDESLRDKTGSMSGSLVHWQGLEEAAKMAGVNASDFSIYDDQTLFDVTGMTRADIEKMKNNPNSAGDWAKTYSGLSGVQKERLLGEYLLKKQGAQWNEATGRWVKPVNYTRTPDSWTNGIVFKGTEQLNNNVAQNINPNGSILSQLFNKFEKAIRTDKTLDNNISPAGRALNRFIERGFLTPQYQSGNEGKLWCNTGSRDVLDPFSWFYDKNTPELYNYFDENNFDLRPVLGGENIIGCTLIEVASERAIIAEKAGLITRRTPEEAFYQAREGKFIWGNTPNPAYYHEFIVAADENPYDPNKGPLVGGPGLHNGFFYMSDKKMFGKGWANLDIRLYEFKEYSASEIQKIEKLKAEYKKNGYSAELDLVVNQYNKMLEELRKRYGVAK